MANKQIKGVGKKTEFGEIVPGFNDTVNGDKITCGSIVMGSHAGKCTVKHNGKQHEINILHNFGASLSLQAKERRFDVDVEALVNHAIAHGLLDDTIAFEPAK